MILKNLHRPTTICKYKIRIYLLNTKAMCTFIYECSPIHNGMFYVYDILIPSGSTIYAL